MTHNEVAFPVSGNNTVSDFLRAFLDTDEVLDGPMLIALFAVDSTVLVLAAQAL